jgi:hypothetical protein
MKQLTLWGWVKDMLFAPSRTKPAVVAAPARRTRVTPRKPTSQLPAPSPPHPPTPSPPHSSPPQAPYATKQALYDDMVRVMCATHNIRVRRWRTSMSGVAWERRYRDGSVARFLESPQPKSPMSAAIFLHEVGHHVIGLGVCKPRCLEEYHAWMYSLAQMEAWGVEVTDKVRDRMFKSLRYAARKAQRRGIKKMPVELTAFL